MRWVRNILKGLSITSVAFVVQACYGTGSMYLDNQSLIHGKVTAKSTGLPIEGIKVTVNNYGQYTFTNSKGDFAFYVEKTEDRMKLLFEDKDLSEHGNFVSKDTTLTDAYYGAYVEMKLDEVK